MPDYGSKIFEYTCYDCCRSMRQFNTWKIQRGKYTFFNKRLKPSYNVTEQEYTRTYLCNQRGLPSHSAAYLAETCSKGFSYHKVIQLLFPWGVLSLLTPVYPSVFSLPCPCADWPVTYSHLIYELSKVYLVFSLLLDHLNEFNKFKIIRYYVFVLYTCACIITQYISMG